MSRKATYASSHYDALKYFIKMKEQGVLRAVGISTHTIKLFKQLGKCMKSMSSIRSSIKRIGIQDGTRDEMLEAIRQAYRNGKGIYGMKPLGGGNLLHSIEESF